MILPSAKAKEFEDKVDELDGKTGRSLHEALMKTVLDTQGEIDNGKMINEMKNQGLSSFMPDLAFEQMCQNYRNAKNIMGERLLREATGHDSDFLERNMKIPEFQRQIKSKMHAKAKELQEQGLLNKKGEILDEGLRMAALSLYVDELDKLESKGMFGEHTHRKASHYGERQETKPYSRGERFRNLAIKHSVKTSIRRGHDSLQFEDMAVFERQSKGQVCVVYALDASGSMRGKKIDVAKRAGVALAYKATERKDKVGVVVFSDHIMTQVYPTTDFYEILSSLTTITASKQTDIAKTIESSIQLFPQGNMTKHLILISDAENTVGDEPKKKVFEAAAIAASQGITITVVGIQIEKETAVFARELALIGKGKLYVVNNLESLDQVILTDYDEVRK